MIKGKTTYYLSSMALAACLTAFPACSADEAAVQEPAPIPPTYDGHTVKTQFAISIPRSEANKRMTAGHTQNSNGFLGMEAIRLIPLGTPYDEVGNAAGITYLDYIIGLDDIDTENGFDDTGAAPAGNVKVYKDVFIPVGTRSFLFYGEAMRDADATDFTQGALETSLDGGNVRTVGDIRFGLKGILGDTDIETPKQTLLNQLNAVMKVNGWNTQRSEKGESDTDEPSMEEKTLANLYANMQKLQAGSAEAIRTTLENLYNTVASIADATDESGQKTIAGNIRAAITSQADGNENALFAPSADGKALAWAGGIEETVSSFPTAQDLPEGAMQLTWDETGGLFKYVDENHNNGEGITVGSVDKVKLNSLTYPAALAYHVCTAAKGNDDPSASFPTAGNWSGADWTTGGWYDYVLATSRLVALKDNIQYSVASLATTVQFASENLPDQSGSLVVTGDQTFSLTGILVGGQPDEVGFDFLPEAATPFDRTVYDHDIEPGSASGGTVYVTTTATSKNYTLLLDNDQGEENNKGQTVNFAIELKNHGEDFRGVDGNLIAKGMTFYLVGQLKPDDGSGEALNKAVDHIFVRDYTTTADVTIRSLQNAYLTIPDLRATNLRLALSVDLQWQQGYTQDVTLP